MVLRSWLAGLTWSALGILTVSVAWGQITPSPGPEISVAATATFQTAPAVAPDGSGGVTIVWQKLTANGWDIFARQYKSEAGGSLVPHAEFQVNTSAVGCQQLPAVAADAAGSFVVVWQSDQDPGGGSGIFARRFDSAGAPRDGTNFQVNTTTVGNQTRPAVAMAPDGSFLVTWQSDSQTGGQGWDIVAQPYHNDASRSGGEILVNVATAGAQHSPRVAYLAAPAAGFAVVWESSVGIFVRRFSPLGGSIDTLDQPVNATTTGTQSNPALASDPSGNYVVAWENLDANGQVSRILARRFQGVTPLNSMTDLTLDTQQHDPAVATDAVGNWVVSWDSVGDDPSGISIVAIQLDNRQVATGPKVPLNNTLTAGDQTHPAVTLSQGGSLLAVWQSLTPVADGAVIEAKAAAVDGGQLYTVNPCRLVDTRGANGSLGGPVLASGSQRIFPVVTLSSCGIPSTAKVLSVNVTAVSATGDGYISLFPGDAPFPGTTTVNFNLATRSTISNNAQIVLSRDGAGTITAIAVVSGAPGQVHLVIDVNGYYQ